LFNKFQFLFAKFLLFAPSNVFPAPLIRPPQLFPAFFVKALAFLPQLCYNGQVAKRNIFFIFHGEALKWGRLRALPVAE